jgi:hypothetical protein
VTFAFDRDRFDQATQLLNDHRSDLADRYVKLVEAFFVLVDAASPPRRSPARGGVLALDPAHLGSDQKNAVSSHCTAN